MSEAQYALAGVVIGAVLGWFGDLITQRAAHRRQLEEKRREEHLALLTDFLRDVELLWLGQQRLFEAIVQIQSDPERRADSPGWAARTEAFEDMREPRLTTELMISRMRIVAPDAVPSAERLRRTSLGLVLIDRYDESMNARAAALRDFESTVRRIVGLPEPPSIDQAAPAGPSTSPNA